ncbi:helix-turn-helix domain-containing protein [Aminobacter sp. MET-1]|uniref:helix-turn-helix domain-containing protein n=1 Tax=Aminobacter sp. MET-1 TaxID=2951085 RepID=UPI002269A82B|nr:helix-turn-helix transcriptional regulator [Aminobacter sp. MET-1]MCX8572983.1 helix-turn-helix transcriptional regulator [Aminobacter sp. MET-1]
MTAEPDIIGIFVTNLRALRQAKGITLAELARRVGYSERYLEIIEHGEVDPSIKTMAEIAQALGVKATQLLAPVLVKPR